MSTRKLKRAATQRAGEVVGGGDIDTSMFWFGDLNVWGAFPTTPTVYQKPRSQVFYMTRNWFERQVFVRQIILLRFAIFNYGFKLSGGGGTKEASAKVQPGRPIQFWEWRNSPGVAWPPRAPRISFS